MEWRKYEMIELRTVRNPDVTGKRTGKLLLK